MIVIGLTGGLASGKTTAARYLEELGARRLDADQLGHESYAPGGPAHDQVVAAFGTEIVAADGRIDRKRLGARVFAEPAELAKLTSIVWPAIHELARARLAAIARETPTAIVVLEAAVLLEAGWRDLLDEVWVVLAPRATQIARATARDGQSIQQIEARLETQQGDATRRAQADRCFENNGDKSLLFAQLEREWKRLLRQTQPTGTGPTR